MLNHLDPASTLAFGLLIFSLLMVVMFEATNGFHDAANAVATLIYTKSLSPGQAVVFSGFMNFIGVLVRGIAVAYALAGLYGVSTKVLNQAVKRNAERFPEDFVFRLTRTEIDVLNRSQFGTGHQKHRDPRFLPYAFTEHGAIMAATILNSPGAVEMSIYVVRAFVQLRELLASNTALARKLDELERRYRHHDDPITAILSAIRELMGPPESKRRSIGFTADLAKKS